MEYSGYLFFLLLCPMPALLLVVSWPSVDTNAVDKIGGNYASRHIKEVIINQEKNFTTHQSSNLNQENAEQENDSILLSLPKQIAGKITKMANTLKAKRERRVKRTLCSCENIDEDCLPECSNPCPCTTAAPTPKIHIIQTPERPPVQSPPVVISPQNPPLQQNLGLSPPVTQPLTNTVPANGGTIGLHPGVVPGGLGTGNAYNQPQSQQTVLLPIPPNPVTNANLNPSNPLNPALNQANQATNLGYSQGSFSRNQFTYANPAGLNMVNPGLNPVTHQAYVIPTNYVPVTTANGIPATYTIAAPSMNSFPNNQQALPGYPNTNQGNFAPQTSNGLNQINQALVSNNVGSQGSSYGHGGTSFGNQGSYVNQGANYGNQGSNYGNQGNSNGNQASNSNNQRPNFGSQGTSYGNQGSNSNNQRPNYGTQGSNGGNQGPSTGNQGSNVNNQRPNNGNQGSSFKNQGSNAGNQGTNYGNQGSSSNNQGSSAGNQGTSYGNQGSDLSNQGTNSVTQGSSQGQSSANQQSNAGNQGSTSVTTTAPNHVPVSAIEVPNSLSGNSQSSPNLSSPAGNSGNTGNANPPSSTISTGPTNPQPQARVAKQTNNPFAPGGSLSTSKSTPTHSPANNVGSSQNGANNIQSNPSVEKHSDRKEGTLNNQRQKLDLEGKPETSNEEAKKTSKAPLKNLMKKLLKKLSKHETSVSEEKGKSIFLKEMTSHKAASLIRKVNNNHSRQNNEAKYRKGKSSRQKLPKGASKNSTHAWKTKFYNRKVAWKKVWKEIEDGSS